MSQLKEKHYIIAYDISDKKRLQKVHRVVKEYAMSLQYSVFIAPFSIHLLDEMVKRLKAVINQAQDDIRIYPLSDNSQPEVYGNRKLPEGIFLNNMMDHRSKTALFF